MRSTDNLRRIRKICLALPDTDEASPFGHPWFRVKEKMLVSFGEHEGAPCVVVKVGKEAMSLFLEDARFFRAPYIGQHGWVGLRITGDPDWEEIEALIRESYEKNRPARNLRKPRA
jgi:predicted DNA-binding protein (MmcQ/YjbR family)